MTVTTELFGTSGATTLSRMNLSGCVGHATIFSSMFTIACCLEVWVRVRIRVKIRLSVWLIRGHTRVLVLLSVVIVTLPHAAQKATLKHVHNVVLESRSRLGESDVAMTKMPRLFHEVSAYALSSSDDAITR